MSSRAPVGDQGGEFWVRPVTSGVAEQWLAAVWVRDLDGRRRLVQARMAATWSAAPSRTWIADDCGVEPCAEDLIMASAALCEGVETHLFFTFWGFDMINKKTMGDLKFTMLSNTATQMPQGLGGLPGMTAMATSKLKKSIADLDVPEVPEFLEQIVAVGGHLL